MVGACAASLPEPTSTDPVPAQHSAAQPEDAAAPTQTTWTGVLDEASFAALHQLKEGDAPELHGETIDLAGGEAYLSLPPGEGPFPGVVVIHEWWGLNDHVRHWTDRLAADGYAAVAVDLYGGEVAADPDGARKLMGSVDEAAAAETLAAAHGFLAADPRIQAPRRGVIGWCFGGGWSLRHALGTADLDAAVIYYGRLETDPVKLGAIEASLLGVFGNEDQGIPPAAVDGFVRALEGAGKSIELHRYDAPHAFANPSSGRYDAASAEDAWGHVRRFLATQLKG